MEKQRDDEHPFTDWTLQKRELLNAGSCGSGIYHLELTPPQDLPLRWQSGALAEILPRHAPDRIALLLQRAQLDGNQSVHFHGQQYTLAAALARSILPALSSGPHAAQATLTTCRRWRRVPIPLPRYRKTDASICWSGKPCTMMVPALPRAG